MGQARTQVAEPSTPNDAAYDEALSLDDSGAGERDAELDAGYQALAEANDAEEAGDEEAGDTAAQVEAPYGYQDFNPPWAVIYEKATGRGAVFLNGAEVYRTDVGVRADGADVVARRFAARLYRLLMSDL